MQKSTTAKFHAALSEWRPVGKAASDVVGTSSATAVATAPQRRRKAISPACRRSLRSSLTAAELHDLAGGIAGKRRAYFLLCSPPHRDSSAAGCPTRIVQLQLVPVSVATRFASAPVTWFGNELRSMR